MFYQTDVVESPQSATEQTVAPGQTIVFEVKADCFAGKFLRCEPMDNISIEGRIRGAAGAFVNLVTDGLPVGAFVGEKKVFDIRATVAANAENGLENAVFAIKS